MKRLSLIVMLIIAILSVQVIAQVKPTGKVKVDPRTKFRINKFKTGKALATVPSTQAKTARETDIMLNTGDPQGTGRGQPQIIKSAQYDNNELACTETLSSLSNTITEYTMLDDNLATNIYPGQLIDGFELIKSGTYKNYTLPANFKRMPYKVEFTEFNRTDGKPMPTPPLVNDIDGDGSFDKSDYQTARGSFMTQLGNTKPSVSTFFQFAEIYSEQQFETEVGVTLSAGISDAAMALLTGVPAGIDLDVDVNTSSNSTEKKSRLLAMAIHEYYDAAVIPTNDNYKTLIEPTANNQLPQTLAYVKSVTYGAIGFVMFESNSTMSELKSAVSVALGVDIGIGDLIDGGHVDASVSASSKEKFSQTKIKMTTFGIGLNGSQPQDVTNIQTVKTWMLGFTPFGNNNPGKPIKFVLKYINTDDLCSVTYRANVISKTCTQKPPSGFKYDVKLKLAKIEAVKVDEGWGGDDTEDLFGRIYLSKSVVGNSKLESKFTHQPNLNKPGEWDYAHTFFHYKESSPFQIAKGKVPVNDPNGEKIIATNQSYDAVKKMQVAIGYTLKDKEINTPKYVCKECDTDNNRVPTPIGEVQLSSINAATPNEWTPLKFGTDNFFEMNFFEEGKDREDGSHIRAWLQIFVKKK
ncbi:MAG TPA: hypothetical protein PKN75_06365 [Bacteroidia bacterium]|nr:hypothetical protein [Bacteroidia bacterium]HNU33198.1 hypothetical protein [Bacteroidia bacterium]